MRTVRASRPTGARYRVHCRTASTPGGGPRVIVPESLVAMSGRGSPTVTSSKRRDAARRRGATTSCATLLTAACAAMAWTHRSALQVSPDVNPVRGLARAFSPRRREYCEPVELGDGLANDGPDLCQMLWPTGVDTGLRPNPPVGPSDRCPCLRSSRRRHFWIHSRRVRSQAHKINGETFPCKKLPT